MNMDANVSSRSNLMPIVLISGTMSAHVPLGDRPTSTNGLSFCAQLPLLFLFWMIWNRTGSALYPLFYFTAPFLALAILVASHRLMKRLAPVRLGSLSGSRTSAKHKGNRT
ncbi:hypothetical protein [Sinorhizobium numidicum]|uniref:hypothetical protein n=1 Tax=Sinorhizobium numidicum TaxID=680248 RepID=UPI0024764E64|nr:hypothetical protein [Sinorhizobium numidicum]